MKDLSVKTNAQEIIETWKTKSSSNYHYFDKAENLSDGFWNVDGAFYQNFQQLDLTSCLELACGHGRHAARIADKCGRLYLVDTSIDAIDFVTRRFDGRPNITCHLSVDGASFHFVPDGSLTSMFSYDAMVHFEFFNVWSYLQEIARTLAPGGRALIHHSNYSANPTGKFTDNPGWRNYMCESTFRHMVSRCGLSILSFRALDWSAPNSDALSLLQKQ